MVYVSSACRCIVCFGDYELDLSLFGWGLVLQAEYEAKQLGEMSDKKALISHMFEEMIGEVRPAGDSTAC